MLPEATMSDRKYGQRGYMDDGPREKRSRQQGPRERSEKPRGRGLGAPTKSAFRCNRCGHSLAAGQAIAVDATCPDCGEDVHSCTNCSHFDTSARFECRQELSEPIPKKAKRNQCELFSPKTTVEFDTDQPSPSDARAAFDSLFDI